jgi:catalase-peroxidase
MMTTADLALRMDPIYEPIARASTRPGGLRRRLRPRLVQADPPRHGPARRYLGPEVPAEELIWQDPVPAVDHPLIDAQDIAGLKARILASGLSVSELVTTAWASASTFRGSDKRGGANGARIRLAPQKGLGGQPARATGQGAGRAGRHPARLQRRPAGGKKVSLADLIVLAGARGRSAAARPPATVEVPFTPAARTPRRSRPTWSPSPCWNRRPTASATTSQGQLRRPGRGTLLDKAQLLTLTAPEMTVLVGGLRVLGANVGRPPTACSPSGPAR